MVGIFVSPLQHDGSQVDNVRCTGRRATHEGRFPSQTSSICCTNAASARSLPTLSKRRGIRSPPCCRLYQTNIIARYS